MNKQDLRKEYKAKRNALDLHLREEFSQKIKDQLFRNFDFSNKTVSIFLPINRLLEIDTYPIFEELKNHPGLQIALSVSDFTTGNMEHQLWSRETIIRENEMGIPEPQKGQPISNSIIDVVIVPLLICDKKGYRVGYGKGFYDRFLKGCKKEITKIGVNYFPPISKIENDKFDIPIDCLVTPDTIYNFNPSIL